MGRGGWNVIDIGRRETGLPTSTMRLLVTVLMTLPARIPRIQSTTPREGDVGSKATTRRQLLLQLQLQLQSLPLALALQLQLQLTTGNWHLQLAVGSGHRQVAGNLQLSHTRRIGKSGKWHAACGMRLELRNANRRDQPLPMNVECQLAAGKGNSGETQNGR